MGKERNTNAIALGAVVLGVGIGGYLAFATDSGMETPHAPAPSRVAQRAPSSSPATGRDRDPRAIRDQEDNGRTVNEAVPSRPEAPAAQLSGPAWAKAQGESHWPPDAAAQIEFANRELAAWSIGQVRELREHRARCSDPENPEWKQKELDLIASIHFVDDLQRPARQGGMVFPPRHKPPGDGWLSVNFRNGFVIARRSPTGEAAHRAARRQTQVNRFNKISESMRRRTLALRAKELTKAAPDRAWLDDIFPEHFVVDWSDATIR